MSKLAHDIILKPIITEESMFGTQMKKYTFKVDKNANKPEIKQAVEQAFNVKVEKVNTINCRGHFRRYGRYECYTASWKKAIVTLTEDSDPIEFFDGLL